MSEEVEFLDMGDLSGVKAHDGSSAPQVGQGDYHVRVDRYERGQSQQNRPKVTIWYEILEAFDEENEEFVGKVFPASYSTDPDKDFALQRMVNLLQAMGIKPGKRGIPLQKFPDKELIVSVEHRQSTSRDPMTDEPKTQTFQNVCRERPLESASAADDDDDADETPKRQRRRKNGKSTSAEL